MFATTLGPCDREASKYIIIQTPLHAGVYALTHIRTRTRARKREGGGAGGREEGGKEKGGVEEWKRRGGDSKREGATVCAHLHTHTDVHAHPHRKTHTHARNPSRPQKARGNISHTPPACTIHPPSACKHTQQSPFKVCSITLQTLSLIGIST